MNSLELTIHTDGGARGNPGPAGIGIVVSDQLGQTHFELGKYLGKSTNNEAEYTAFFESLAWLETKREELSIAKVTWKLDSLLVVEQLNRRWKIKEPRMQVFAQKIWEKLKTLSFPYEIRHVRREENKEADLLVNQALDAQPLE
jgi:ribonuclease HI